MHYIDMTSLASDWLLFGVPFESSSAASRFSVCIRMTSAEPSHEHGSTEPVVAAGESTASASLEPESTTTKPTAAEPCCKREKPGCPRNVSLLPTPVLVVTVVGKGMIDSRMWSIDLRTYCFV